MNFNLKLEKINLTRKRPKCKKTFSRVQFADLRKNISNKKKTKMMLRVSISIKQAAKRES